MNIISNCMFGLRLYSDRNFYMIDKFVLVQNL